MQILYFAWLKERMGRSGEALALPPGVGTVGELMAWLRARDDRGERALGSGVVRAAINGEFAQPGDPVADSDEVALFPPVTGG